MNVPENLPLTDDQGRPRKNGEERKAINFLLECERERQAMTEASRNGAVPGDEHGPYEVQNMRDHGFSEELITAPHIPTDRMTLQSSVGPAEWSNAYREAEGPADFSEIPAGTIDEEYFGPDSPNVRIMEKWQTKSGEFRGTWMTIRREEARARSMVAEDEANGTSGEPA